MTTPIKLPVRIRYDEHPYTATLVDADGEPVLMLPVREAGTVERLEKTLNIVHGPDHDMATLLGVVGDYLEAHARGYSFAIIDRLRVEMGACYDGIRARRAKRNATLPKDGDA